MMSENHYPEERRLASVLFADVQGFTALAEKLDFETVSDLIKGIWNRLDKVIEAHGGYIDKHLGDGIMAVWGAPFASDNDAEQAIAAGLELVQALEEFCLNVRIHGAEQLKLRVGINSGAVFAGYIGHRNEYTVLGDTVNVAARLEQIGEAGKVVIGENTFRMVRTSFKVKRLEPVKVKGKTEPVQAYMIEGHLQTTGRARYQSSDSLVTHVVARENELERLRAVFEYARASQHPQMALLHGEVGIGKSRLLLEFSNYLEEHEENIHAFSTRGLAQTSRIPFYLWRMLLRNQFNLRDDDQPSEATEKWNKALSRLWENGPQQKRLETTQVLGEMMGLSVSSAAKTEADLVKIYALTIELLQKISKNEPLVLFFDDLQWADRESLQLLAFLLSLSEPKMTVLVVGAARPEFLKNQTQWHNLARVISLEPIKFNAELVSLAYPDLQLISDDVLEIIAAKAEGNPYFMEEIVKSLVKSSFLTAKSSSEEIKQHLLTQIPESLRATLQARLDNLSREARSVALMASVVGRVFWVGSIMAQAKSAALPGTISMMNAPVPVVERFIQDGLRQLVRAELAFPRKNSQFSEEQEYIFKNTYLRDVAYNLISNRNRAQLHKIVADWLEKHIDPAFKSMAQDHRQNAECSAKISTGSLPNLQSMDPM